MEAVLSSNSPDPSVLQTFRPSPQLLRRQASSLSRVYPNTGNSPSPHSCVHPLRHKLVPSLRGFCHPPLSSEKVCLSTETIQTQYRLNSTVLPCVYFVQDLCLEKPKPYKPAPKVPCPAPSPVLNLNPHSRGCPSFRLRSVRWEGSSLPLYPRFLPFPPTSRPNPFPLLPHHP